MKNKLLLLDGLVWFTVYLSISILSLFFGAYLPGGNTALAGFSVGLFFLIRAITDIVSPKIFVKVSKRKLLSQVCISSLFLIAGYLILYVLHNVQSSLLALILIGISLGLYNPAKYALYASLEKNLNESKWGLLDSVGLFTVAFSSSVSGLLVSTGGFVLVFLVALLLSIVIFIYSLNLVVHYKSSN